MSLAKTSLWTASSTLVKIAAGLLVVKLLAVSYGPEGVGQAGNFRQLITVLGVLAGAGIFNGVTTGVAQYRHQPERLRAITGTASAMVLGFSTLLALIFLLAAGPVSQALFGHNRYKDVVRILAFLQFGIAWASLALAVLKGYRDARGNALSLISGSAIGVVAYMLCWKVGGYQGALIGLALVPALVVFPAMLMLKKREPLLPGYFKPQWHPDHVRNLAKYTLMALITSVTLPVAWIMMRNMLAGQDGWSQVGLWQGVTSISDAWLQFITATFSVWLLPTLARLDAKRDIAREILRALRFVLPAAAVASVSVWLLRDVAVWLLFSPSFSAMRDLFVWQLCGDVFKVGAYVFGYLVIAKASLRFYILTEISQFVLLLAFSRWLIPLSGVTGAVQAYMATYICYFALCCGAFILYCRKK